MVTAVDLKEKVTKILTIIEHLDNENINQIEKDILLQELRELYSSVLLVETEACASENNDLLEYVEESPAKENDASASVDECEIDVSDLFDFDDVEIQSEEKESEVEQEAVAAESEEHLEEVAEKEETDAFAEENIDEETVAEDDVEKNDDETLPFDDEVEETAEQSAEEQVEAEPADDPFGDVEEPAVEEIVEQKVEVAEETVEQTSMPEEVVMEEPKEPEAAKPAEPVVENREEPKPAEPEKSITLGEQLGQTRQTSLNDMLATQKQSDLSGAYGQKPISDIKAAIALGDRFRYTRILFDGKAEMFEKTVTNLNGLKSIEEAYDYVKAEFAWDMESAAVTDFMNIVRRRYL